MALLGSLANTAIEQRAIPTQNGLMLFYNGAFYMGYNPSGYGVNTTASEYSIFNGQNDSSNANFVANTIWTSGTSNPSVMTPINLSADPTGLGGPKGNLLLPGSSQANIPWGPMGAFTVGTLYTGAILGSINSTGTPTFQVRMHLRNPTTGKVAYTIADTTAFTTTAISGGPLGLYIVPTFQVLATGTSGKLAGWVEVNYGASGYEAAPVITTVDTTQSYILDISVKWGTSSASNAVVIYSAALEIVG